jgi:hypothetical protein
MCARFISPRRRRAFLNQASFSCDSSGQQFEAPPMGRQEQNRQLGSQGRLLCCRKKKNKSKKKEKDDKKAPSLFKQANNTP